MITLLCVNHIKEKLDCICTAPEILLIKSLCIIIIWFLNNNNNKNVIPASLSTFLFFFFTYFLWLFFFFSLLLLSSCKCVITKKYQVEVFSCYQLSLKSLSSTVFPDSSPGRKRISIPFTITFVYCCLHVMFFLIAL